MSEDNEPWGRTVYATVLEARHRKTKVNRECQVYVLERIKCDIGGIAVLVRKQDGETHHVHLDRTLGDSCTCPGGTYKGQCRHREMVRIALGIHLV